MEWAWKCCGNCHLSDKCELKEELVDKGQFCEKYLPKPINEELDFVQEHKKIPVNLQIIKQEPKTDVLDKIRAEISEAMDMEPAWKGQDNYIGGLQIACSIIDKYRQAEQEPKICEKCLYAEETDGSHCYECVKGENRFEPQTGHWIQINEFFINPDGQFIYKFICSECKTISYFRKSNKKAIGANVCPNCGCKMEG